MGFQITTFVAPEAVNPYLDDVAAFAKDNADKADAAFTIDVPAKDQTRHELWVRKAANAVDKTARLRKADRKEVKVAGQTDKGKDILEGTVYLTYTLREKDKGGKGRKPKEVVETDAEVEATVPATKTK